MKKNINLLEVIFVTFIPNYIIVSYSVPQLMQMNKKFLACINISWGRITYLVIIIIGTLVVPIIFQITKANKEDKKSKILGDLLYGINTVVNTKRQRFHSVVHRNVKMNRSQIFDTITQPQMQKQTICTSLWTMFKSLVGDNELKLILVSYSKDHFVNLDVSTSGDDVSEYIPKFLNNQTIAKESAKKKKLIIIENKAEVSFFYEISGSQCNIRSMIAFPICNETETRFVLCLSSHHEYTFKERDKDIYNLIFKEFENRIILESYLDELKG